MQKQKQAKKLTLRRETLTALELRQIAGRFGSGSVNCTTLISTVCTNTCPSDCPTCFSEQPDWTCYPQI